MKKGYNIFKNKKIFVTGGLGSIGKEIVNQLLIQKPSEIRIYDNRETEMFYIGNNYSQNKRITTIFGDIRDKETLLEASKDIDIMFHASAMKHVIICEKSPFEAIKTNVLGTQNLIECALQNKVKRMVLISTDKAVNPTNVMGATKLLAERLVSAHFHIRKKEEIKFSIVRFGNVLASRGSVLEIWENELSNNKQISITNKNMTRFFMSIPDSVRLIFQSAKLGTKGETFVFKMPSVKIMDLAKAFLKIKGEKSNNYKIVGIRTGEKMHEELLNKEEQHLLLENKQMFIRLPIFFNTKLLNHYLDMGFRKNKISSFSSKDPGLFLTQEKIIKVLQRLDDSIK